ncbi:MAG: EipB family protein [Alphaproteobacteria bacterium]
MARAYHALAAGDADTPQFALSFELFAPGVTRDVRLDDAAFALEAELERFEPLSPPRGE